MPRKPAPDPPPPRVRTVREAVDDWLLASEARCNPDRYYLALIPRSPGVWLEAAIFAAPDYATAREVAAKLHPETLVAETERTICGCVCDQEEV